MESIKSSSEPLIFSIHLQQILESHKYVTDKLDKLHAAIRKTRREMLAESIMFLQDNAPCHKALITIQKMDQLGHEMIDHPSYSPRLAQSDFYLFSI